MRRIIQTIMECVVQCMVALVLFQLLVSPTLAADLTYQQQEAIWTDFSNWDKAIGVSSKAFQELVGNEETNQFLEDYGNAVLVINVSKELFHTGDLAAAARLIKDKLQDKVIEKITPGFHSWLGWISWAKTGMELFKDFIFDPMVEQSQLDTYFGLREAGNEPEDAWAGVRGYGYIVERAKKEFRKQYGDLPFQAGSNDLLPNWEANFLQFAKAGMEAAYHKKLHQDALQKYKAAAAQAEAQLLELREQLLLLLKQSTVEKLEVKPSTVELHVGEEVTFEAIGVFADPSAPRSAADLTGECTWSGGTSDNVFRATESDVGNVSVVIADYNGVKGQATVTVLDTDCGDHGRWNSVTEICDCDSGFTWSEDLFECVESDGEVTEGETREVLGDLEQSFFRAVSTFDDYYDDFVAALQAHVGSSEDICADERIAFLFTRAAVSYDIVESFYFDALDLVGRGDRGLNWEAIAVGNYESDIAVRDQIRLEIFRKDYKRVQGLGEGLPTLLAEYAPGCDPEDVLDRGSRIADTDQDAETGVAGTGEPGGGGGGGGGGEGLRLEKSGQLFTQVKTQGTCSGGSLTLNVTPPTLPDVILANETFSFDVTYSWSTGGGNVDDVVVALEVWFGTQRHSAPQFKTFSGSRTERITFTAFPDEFAQPATAISVIVGGGILCLDNGGSDDVGATFNQGYIRKQ